MNRLLVIVLICTCSYRATAQGKTDTLTSGPSSNSACNSAGNLNIPDDPYCMAIVLVGFATIISNDVYFYPVASNWSMSRTSGRFRITEQAGTGFAAGYRIHTGHGAWEYGITSVFVRQHLTSSSVDSVSTFNRTGVHLNFVHDVLLKETPEWMRVYIGGTVNYNFRGGAGVIAGVKFRIIGRLKADLRYEWTTTTRQAQAGLIFTYQKKSRL
jgi:hypothetical protein